ncbi:hypothetical protein C8F01DRAFT_1176178 [Mycena amicta]|nr:hypothetical protein C8F01DRAFT_1176178 [Mycena amicta]
METGSASSCVGIWHRRQLPSKHSNIKMVIARTTVSTLQLRVDDELEAIVRTLKEEQVVAAVLRRVGRGLEPTYGVHYFNMWPFNMAPPANLFDSLAAFTYLYTSYGQSEDEKAAILCQFFGAFQGLVKLLAGMLIPDHVIREREHRFKEQERQKLQREVREIIRTARWQGLGADPTRNTHEVDPVESADLDGPEWEGIFYQKEPVPQAKLEDSEAPVTNTVRWRRGDKENFAAPSSDSNLGNTEKLCPSSDTNRGGVKTNLVRSW